MSVSLICTMCTAWVRFWDIAGGFDLQLMGHDPEGRPLECVREAFRKGHRKKRNFFVVFFCNIY